MIKLIYITILTIFYGCSLFGQPDTLEYYPKSWGDSIQNVLDSIRLQFVKCLDENQDHYDNWQYALDDLENAYDTIFNQRMQIENQKVYKQYLRDSIIEATKFVYVDTAYFEKFDVLFYDSLGNTYDVELYPNIFIIDIKDSKSTRYRYINDWNSWSVTTQDSLGLKHNERYRK